MRTNGLICKLVILACLYQVIYVRECNTRRNFPSACLAENMCVEEIANGLTKPRGLAIDGDQLFVVTRDSRVHTMKVPQPDDPEERPQAIIQRSGINHGIAVTNTHIFVSSPSDVYRYTRNPSDPYADLTESEVHIIQNIPTGGHVTRTLLVLKDELYVQVGSGGNVDVNSDRAQVRLFKGIANPDYQFTSSLDFYNDSDLAFDGLRNEVGLKVDPVLGHIYGVENGMDNIKREDLTQDNITNENPCEELNRMTEGFQGGYPYCFSNGINSALPGKPGTQYADLRVQNSRSDAWCQDPLNVDKPFYCMEAHIAPLGLTFTKVGKDSSLDSQIVVSNHGSWNRSPPKGYNLILLRFDADRSSIVSSERIFYNCGDSEDWESGLRPVDVVTGSQGELIFTDDGSNKLFLIREIRPIYKDQGSEVRQDETSHEDGIEDTKDDIEEAKDNSKVLDKVLDLYSNNTYSGICYNKVYLVILGLAISFLI